VTDQGARYDPRFDFVVNDPEHKGDDANFLATVLEQSRLNRIAAIYTPLAILFQAAASRPLIESWIRR
jgi:type I restriction-modification system DNA methylase subunit